MDSRPKILFVKPPDRFLENEFSYQQLGPHYLQSYLNSHGIGSDILIAYVDPAAPSEARERIEFDSLKMLLLSGDIMIYLLFRHNRTFTEYVRAIRSGRGNLNRAISGQIC